MVRISQMRTFSEWFGVKWKWETFFPGEHQDINDQVNTIQNRVTSKFDAVLVCTAGDFAAMQKVYDSAAAKGTRVFQYNMPAEPWPEDQMKAICTIGYNNAMQAGYIATDYIAQKLGGKGKLILIGDCPGIGPNHASMASISLSRNTRDSRLSRSSEAITFGTKD